MSKNKFLRNIWYSLSARQRFNTRKLIHLPLDIWDTLTNKTNKYVPPRGMIYTGSATNAENYVSHGKQQLTLLEKHTKINSSSSVLDIGSGLGRTALALTNFLSKEGSYHGFDVVKKGVDWCVNRISPDFPNFKFTYTPLYNDLYTSSGKKATDFTFPYNDNTFDTIFSFSVFTHMQINEIQHYLSEIRRSLTPEGIAFSTFFIYDSSNEDFISSKKGFNFPINKKTYRLMDTKVTSGNIAIHEEKLKQMLSEEGLELIKITEGFWKDQKRNTLKEEYQDIVTFKRKQILPK